MTSASGNGGSQPGSQPGSEDEIIRLLSDPAVFGPVDRVETHVSLVFLGPRRVYKLKRAVPFPYLDFSTPEKRRLACEAEIRINRRTAPSIYLGVVAITRQANGTLALDGDGEAVDWVVEMERFDEHTLFDRLARKGGLDRAMMEDLTDAIADKLFGQDYMFSVLAAGRHQIPLTSMAAAMGGHVRVGLEDNLMIARGQLAPGNAAQVDKIRRIVEALGREVASPGDARQMLGLKGADRTAI